MTVFCGTGDAGFNDGDCGTAWFDGPAALTVVNTTLFVADTGTHLVRAIDLQTATVTTVAGSGSSGYTDGFDLSASFESMTSMSTLDVDSVAHVLITEAEGRVRVMRTTDCTFQPALLMLLKSFPRAISSLFLCRACWSSHRRCVDGCGVIDGHHR